MDVAGVLTTTAFDPVPRFLPGTLACLDDAGVDALDDKFVLCDGPIEDASPRRSNPYSKPWDVVVKEDGPSGSVQGLAALCREALRRGADRLFLFEDDIVACENAVKAMRRVTIPDGVGAVAFFDFTAREFGMDAPAGLYVMPLHRSFNSGHQAVLLPRKVVEILARPHASQTDNASESWIQQCILRAGLRYYALHQPCFFDHVGDSYSRTLGGRPRPPRRATRFPGLRFDAERL